MFIIFADTDGYISQQDSLSERQSSGQEVTGGQGGAVYINHPSQQHQPQQISQHAQHSQASSMQDQVEIQKQQQLQQQLQQVCDSILFFLA